MNEYAFSTLPPLKAPLETPVQSSAQPNWNALKGKIRDHFVRNPVLKPQIKENEARVRQLEQLGMVVIEDLLSREEVTALAQRLQPTIVDCARNRLTQNFRHTRWPHYGRFRVFEIHEHHPEVMEVFSHPTVTDLVQSYMSQQGALKTTILELRVQPPSWDAALVDLYPHCDHIYREVKVFLALEDIEMKHGPMIYWTRTHLDGEWRRLPDYLFSIGGVWSESHIMTEMAIDSLMGRHPEFQQTQRVACVVPAGSLYIVDTRGLHRAGFLEGGHRFQIYGEYAMRGYERHGIPCKDHFQPLNLG